MKRSKTLVDEADSWLGAAIRGTKSASGRRRISDRHDEGKLTIGDIPWRSGERLSPLHQGDRFPVEDGGARACHNSAVQQTALPIDAERDARDAGLTGRVAGIAFRPLKMGDKRSFPTQAQGGGTLRRTTFGGRGRLFGGFGDDGRRGGGRGFDRLLWRRLFRLFFRRLRQGRRVGRIGILDQFLDGLLVLPGLFARIDAIALFSVWSWRTRRQFLRRREGRDGIWASSMNATGEPASRSDSSSRWIKASAPRT